MQTVPPNDFGHYELLDALVQLEPVGALDVELAGQFAAIGIIKDEKFAPDDRMRRILDQAAEVGNAASRTLGMGAHPTDDYRYYDSGAWWNMLFVGGFEFTNPPPRSPPRVWSRSQTAGRASSTPAPPSSTPPPASPLPCACGSPASAPST